MEFCLNFQNGLLVKVKTPDEGNHKYRKKASNRKEREKMGKEYLPWDDWKQRHGEDMSWIPRPTRQLTTICTFSHKRFDVLLLPLWLLDIQRVHRHICRHNTHTHKMYNKKYIRLECWRPCCSNTDNSFP